MTGQEEEAEMKQIQEPVRLKCCARCKHILVEYDGYGRIIMFWCQKGLPLPVDTQVCGWETK